jgi:hypothetical protein
VKALAQSLYQSGRLFVDSSLAAYDRVEPHVFLLHAGIALEHLLKARLADLNPALVAKRDHVASLVWFADETKHGGMAPVEMRTITLDEALALVTALGVPLTPYREHLGVVQRYRNGVAHLGVADGKIGYDVLPTVLQVFILLASDLEVDPAELFGHHNGFVLSQLDEYHEREERLYEGRVAQARMRFGEDHGTLSAEGEKHLRELAELKWHRLSLDEQLIQCVVCGLPAYAHGSLEIVDWDVDYDREGNAEHVSPVVEYRAVDVRCPTCGLVLDTPGLIEVSGILEDWTLPDEDYEDFLREYYESEREWDYDDLR